MRVLIADDQPRVRASLKLLLQRETEMNIVAEVSDFEGLLVQAKLSCPDLVLLDWGLPGVPSVDVIARLRAECSGVRVIAISGRPEVEQSALASGAVAFVSKADPPEKLLEAILAVNQAENSQDRSNENEELIKEIIMLNQSTKSTLVPASTNQYRLAPQRLALTIMWLVTTVVTISMLLLGVRDTNQYRVARLILQAGYVAALLWYLSRSGSSISQLPELGPHLFPRWRVGPWIPVLGIALLFALTLVSDDGVYIMMLLMMVATGPILLIWRSEIRLRSVVQGLALAFIAFLAGLQMAKNGYLSNLSLYLLPAFSFPMYIAGGLLFERTRLGGIQLLVGQYGKSVKSVILGALLFIPLGLFNAASGSPGPGPTGVTKWWMPLWLPWFSGITEETWFRLLLVGLIYFLLRPVFQKHPALAVLAAILFSGITFGLGHGRTLDIFLTTGLLYGVPLAAIFARRDWEYAVGAHYMINMIPTLMVFLET